MYIYASNCRKRIEFDDSDWKKIMNYTWYAQSERGTYYAKTSDHSGDKHRTIRMHRLLAGARRGQVVDHADRNGLNNRRSNLRIASLSQNLQNRRGAQKNSKTGIRGVSWWKAGGMWMARVVHQRRLVYCDYFDDIRKARSSVIKARRKYLGEYCGGS